MDCVELLLLHTVGPRVPIEESFGALAELAQAGFAKQVGVSNVSSDQLSRARRVHEVAAVQNCLNLFDREHLDLARTCVRDSIRFFAWWPLRGGELAVDERIEAAMEGLTAAETALAWIRTQAPRATPVVGITRPAELDEALRGSATTLDEATVERVETIAA